MIELDNLNVKQLLHYPQCRAFSLWSFKRRKCRASCVDDLHLFVRSRQESGLKDSFVWKTAWKFHSRNVHLILCGATGIA